MSAITGIGESATMVFSASTSFSRGTATRTRSEPASATLRICSMVAPRFAVSVLVIVWTTTGAPPPIGTSLTHICRLEAIRPKGIGVPRPGQGSVVKGVDLLRVLLDDRLSLQLHRGRQLVASRLPVGGEDLELLHLLDAGELLVGRVEALLDLGDQLLVGGKRLGVLVGAVLGGPALGRLRVERQQ